MNKKIETANDLHCCHPHHFKRISWTAIFVGAIVGVGLGFLLNLFGVAIGLSAFTMSDDGAIVVAVGGLIGIIIGIIASMFVAGYTAGYLSRFCCPQRNLGIVYGFTTWSVALLLTAVIAAQVSSYVTSYSNAISHSLFVASENKANSSVTLTDKMASTANQHKKTMKLSVSTSSLACSTFSVFVLFFIGALSSCLGACCGLSCKRED